MTTSEPHAPADCFFGCQRHTTPAATAAIQAAQASASFHPEFDSVFEVLPEGVVIERHDVYAPSVFHDEGSDVYIDSKGWEPLTGYTGQHGYRGAVMHASEQFAGRIRNDVLATPGVYVLAVVDVLDEEDAEPAGWAVLRRTSDVDQINRLAALIREVDGKHELGAGALAERLVERGVRL